MKSHSIPPYPVRHSSDTSGTFRTIWMCRRQRNVSIPPMWGRSWVAASWHCGPSCAKRRSPFRTFPGREAQRRCLEGALQKLVQGAFATVDCGALAPELADERDLGRRSSPVPESRVGESRRRQIRKRGSGGLEQRDFPPAAAAGRGSPAQAEQVAGNPLLCQRAGPDRSDEVATLLQGALRMALLQNPAVW